MRRDNYHIRKKPSKKLLRHPLLLGLALISVYGIGFFWLISDKQTNSEKHPQKSDAQVQSSVVKSNDKENNMKVDSTIADKTRVGEGILVTKNNVHVRQKPVDGFILGKVSREDRVVFIERKLNWCHVKTSNHKGWMICDALAL